jgi:hypothetical protein
MNDMRLTDLATRFAAICGAAHGYEVQITQSMKNTSILAKSVVCKN